MQTHIKEIYARNLRLSFAVLFIVTGLVCGASNTVAGDIISNIMAEQFGAPGDPDNRSIPLIIYIGTNDYPLENADAAARAGVNLGVYNLDAQRNLERRMMDGLPTSPEESNLDINALQRIVEQRFNALSQDELRSIFQPVMLAERWDIRKAPAFIFGNGEAVVYGLTDVLAILKLWQEWQTSK